MEQNFQKLSQELDVRMRSLRRTIAFPEAPVPQAAPLSAHAAARAAAPASAPRHPEASIGEIGGKLDELRKEVAGLTHPQISSFEARIAALEKQCAEFGKALGEVRNIESFMKDARQKQYETFIEDRGKLRVDYLDLKQEVMQKLKVMQLRIEDLIAASAAQSFRSVDPSADSAKEPQPFTAGQASEVESLSSLPAEEKGLFQKVLEWWNEPVVTFDGSKKRAQEAVETGPD